MDSTIRLSDLVLTTSNPNKLAEFRRFGLADLRMEAGPDLREADADPKTVVLHKALAAGEGRIVEDTSLEVDGMPVGANVKWLVQDLLEGGPFVGRRAVWIVWLGVSSGGFVRLYEGRVEGVLGAPIGEGWGFDPVFRPDGADELTNAQLDAQGRKDAFSARRAAVSALIGSVPSFVEEASRVEPWRGPWQT